MQYAFALFAATVTIISIASRSEAASSGDTLSAGEVLFKGDYLISNNGVYSLIMQEDGNLVLYLKGATKALWASGTAGRVVWKCTMQSDGNLVIYQDYNPIWKSHTQGHPGAKLILQDDGNAVIYSLEGVPIWSTHTSH